MVASEAADVAARGMRRRTASVPERDLLLVASELARKVGLASGSVAQSSRHPSKRRVGRSEAAAPSNAAASGASSSGARPSPDTSDSDSDSYLNDGLSDDQDDASGSDAVAAVSMLRRLRNIAALTGGKAEIGLEDLDILTNIVQGVAYGAADQGTFEHAMTQHFVHNPDVFDDPEVKSYLMAQYIPHHGAVGSFGTSQKQRTVRALAAAGGLRAPLGGYVKAPASARGTTRAFGSRHAGSLSAGDALPAAANDALGSAAGDGAAPDGGSARPAGEEHEDGPPRESDVIAATGIGPPAPAHVSAAPSDAGVAGAVGSQSSG